MRLRYLKHANCWQGVRDRGDVIAVSGSFWQAARYVLFGKLPKPRRFPSVRFLISDEGSVGHSQDGPTFVCGSAGFYHRWLYVEFLQGYDFCTGIAYRWLRIGIPTHGCWRIRLMKRAV
jgi:hypothetical protein